MSLFDEIKSEPTGRQDQCSLTQWLKDIPEADRKGVLDAIADRSIASVQIGRVLARRGYGAADPDQIIRRHRTQHCKSCVKLMKTGMP